MITVLQKKANKIRMIIIEFSLLVILASKKNKQSNIKQMTEKIMQQLANFKVLFLSGMKGCLIINQ